MKRLGPCPACDLGQPEIIGRQEHEPNPESGDGIVTRWRVQCPTCGHGLGRPKFVTPELAVDYWNAGQTPERRERFPLRWKKPELGTAP